MSADRADALIRWAAALVRAVSRPGRGWEDAVRYLWEDLLGPLTSDEDAPRASEEALVVTEPRTWHLRIGEQWWRAQVSPGLHKRLLPQVKDLQTLQQAINRVGAQQRQAAAARSLAEQMGRRNEMLLRAVAALRHDLGNVLSPVLTRLALLQQESSVGLPKHVEEELRAVRAYLPLVQGMVTRIDDMMALLIGQKEQSDLESVDLGEQVEAMFGEYLARQRVLRETVRVSWNTPRGVYVRMDPAAFFQAIWNVLHNAFKFTKEGQIEIRVRAGEGWGWVQVSDTGPGIPEEDRKRLVAGSFGYRGANAEAAPGSGIGLWVAAQLMHSMGGKLLIQPNTPRGTRISLGFPMAEKDNA